MPSFVVFHSGSIESYFNQAMQYLDNKFHTYPSNITEQSISDFESAQISSNDALVQNIVNDACVSRGTPVGNLVI